MMRPFFSYYGSRWSVSKLYGEPTSDIVVEPFCGSAGYSTRWEPERAVLTDLSSDICAIWTWLIAATPDSVFDLPEAFENINEIKELPEGARQLVLFWVNKGRAEAGSSISPWYFEYRGDGGCRVWGRQVQERIASQVDKIRNWEIHQGQYFRSPRPPDAHYHVDPPFKSNAGSRYPCSVPDYDSLADWCRGLPGYVQVCERSDADWLPFQTIGSSETTRGKRSDTRFSEGSWTSTQGGPR